MELDEDGVILGSHGHGSGSAQGLAVDGAGNVWVSHTFGTTVGHVRTDGTFVGNVSLLGSSGTTGVAVDVNGKIWSANIGGDTSRIDPEIGPVGGGGFPTGWVDLTVDLGSGSGPYNYSDMTGFVSIAGTSPTGVLARRPRCGIGGCRLAVGLLERRAAGSRAGGHVDRAGGSRS